MLCLRKGTDCFGEEGVDGAGSINGKGFASVVFGVSGSEEMRVAFLEELSQPDNTHNYSSEKDYQEQHFFFFCTSCFSSVCYVLGNI